MLTESTETIRDDGNAIDNGKSAAEPAHESAGGNTGSDSGAESAVRIDDIIRDDNPSDGYGYTEPVSGIVGDIGGKRKRGRPVGSKNRDATIPQAPQALSGLKLEDLLYSLHLMGAEILKVSDLELDKQESKKLADAITEVAKFHAVEFDPKKVAYFNLFAVCGGIYGTRLLAWRARKKIEAENKADNTIPISRPSESKKEAAPKPDAAFKGPKNSPFVGNPNASPSEVYGFTDNSW